MTMDVVDTRRGKSLVKITFTHEEWKALDERLKEGLSLNGIIAHVGSNISCMVNGSAFGIGKKE